MLLLVGHLPGLGPLGRSVFPPPTVLIPPYSNWFVTMTDSGDVCGEDDLDSSASNPSTDWDIQLGGHGQRYQGLPAVQTRSTL